MTYENNPLSSSSCMARPRRFERPTTAFGGLYSIQLSYGQNNQLSIAYKNQMFLNLAFVHIFSTVRAKVASFRRLPSGAWQAIIRRKGVKPLSKTFTQKTDAQRWAREQEIKIDQGAFASQVEIGQMTFGDLVDRYRVEVTPRKRGATQELYKFNYIRDALGHYSLVDLQAKHIADFRDKRLAAGKAGATVIRDLNLIASVIEVARKDWSLPIQTNPTRLVSRPERGAGRSRRLADDELEKLLAALSETAEVGQIVQLLLATGMRRSELLAAQWKHVDLEQRYIFLPCTKNGHSRYVPLGATAVQLIKELPKTGDNLFSIKPGSVSQAFGRACKRSGISNLRLHDLRHEAVSRLFERGLNMMEAASVSGHRTLQMLKRYTHLRPTDIAKKLD